MSKRYTYKDYLAELKAALTRGTTDDGTPFTEGQKRDIRAEIINLETNAKAYRIK